MFRKITIKILILFICFDAFSNSFKGGATAGVTFCQVDGDNLSGFNKPGGAAGFFVNRNIKNNFSYQFEIKYVEKGRRAKSSVDNPVVDILSLKYIEFPLSGRYLYKKKYLFEGGLYGAYLFKTTVKDENGVVEQGLQESYKKSDVGLLAGGNYLINDHFIFNIRYSYTLIRIYKIPDGTSTGPWFHRGHYNNVINLSLYYQF
jgi:hypothetical protein